MIRSKNKNTRRAALLAIALCAGIAVSAQNMSTQIVVERQIEPEYRAAIRPSGISPTALTPSVKTPTMTAAPYSALARLNPSMTQLEPAAWGDALYVSPYRGYATIGYLPAMNANAALGYTFINTRDTRVNAFFQYLGNKYHGYRDNLDGAFTDGRRQQLSLSHQNILVGANAFHRLDSRNTLAATLGYNYGSTEMPRYSEGYKDTFTQGVNRAYFTADWAHRGNFAADAGASVRYFGFTKDIDLTPVTVKPVSPMSEAIYEIHADVSTPTAKWMGRIRANATWQHHSPAPSDLFCYPQFNPEAPTIGVLTYGSYNYQTNALYTITPSAEIRTGSFTGIFGIRVDISEGGNTKQFYVAPDVRLAWNISSKVALWGRAGGGKVLNTLEDLYNYTPFMSGAFAYDMSSIPYTLDAGINLGPFSGFTVTLEAGWAKSPNWLMPVACKGINAYESIEVSGEHYRAAIAWDATKWLSAHASIEGASHIDDDNLFDDSQYNGYYLWRDRARWQTNIGVTLRPVKPLTLNIDWSLRTKRRAFTTEPAAFFDHGYLVHKNEVNLGNINDLSASATWQFSKQISAYAQLNNLLCRRYYIIPGVVSPRMSGTVGVSFQF